MPLDPKIAIIGAGISGLTFARLIQQSNLTSSFTLYEADSNRHARTQGGSLDIRPESGQRAIKAAGLWTEFERFSRPEAQVMKLVKGDGEVVLDENVTGNERDSQFDDWPEIDRDDLRGLLLDSLEEGRVVWGKKVERVIEIEGMEGKFRVCFADGSEQGDFGLVVGADGAWSKVRPLVTEVKPYYSGVTLVDVWVKDVSTRQPWLSNYVGAGSCFMFDEGRALLCQRNGNDIVRLYACVRQPESWRDTCGIDWNDGHAVRNALEKDYFGSCGDEIRRALRAAHGDIVVRPLYMMPVGHRWNSRPGVALIGDAAHVFTPFAGEGVNLAMTDAVELAERLTVLKNSRSIASEGELASLMANAVEHYDLDMFERATELAEKTARGLKGHFERDGVIEMAERLTRRQVSELQEEQGEWKPRHDQAVAARTSNDDRLHDTMRV